MAEFITPKLKSLDDVPFSSLYWEYTENLKLSGTKSKIIRCLCPHAVTLYVEGDFEVDKSISTSEDVVADKEKWVRIGNSDSTEILLEPGFFFLQVRCTGAEAHFTITGA